MAVLFGQSIQEAVLYWMQSHAVLMECTKHKIVMHVAIARKIRRHIVYGRDQEN